MSKSKAANNDVQKRGEGPKTRYVQRQGALANAQVKSREVAARTEDVLGRGSDGWTKGGAPLVRPS